MEVAPLIRAFDIVTSWPTIGWILFGLLFGTVIGMIPGLGPNLGMAVVLPLTIKIDGISAVLLLISIYSGAMYGGSVAAILINAPGTAAAAATTFDGYPMSRQGRARDALSISAISSAFGGAFTILLLIFLSPLLVFIVLLFGSPEYFLIAILGLALITIVAEGSMVKGLTAGAFGLLLTSIGLPVMTAEPRYTLGLYELYNGIHFVVALIGVFAIGEMIKLANEQEGKIAQGDIEVEGSVLTGAKEVIYNPVTTIKSALIGGLIGAIPGAGASISNFISYGEAMRSNNEEGTFGNGDPKGVIASEAANNGTVSGSLIPTLSFGIPGSGSMAVLLGGLLMHGIRPGPDLFTTNLYVTQSIFLALLLGNIVILVAGVLLFTRAGIITRIDTTYIIPLVIIFAVLGSFSLRGNWFDVLSVFAFGVLGFYMSKHDYSIIALVLGIVLGTIVEENLYRSMQLSGDIPVFFTRPLSIVLIVAILAILFAPVIKNRWGRREATS
ncbi:tripartite tricarboxylate transporter permease [Halobellus rubicundus]|uniref:Tripartite tricarboxylate transporter permease n=1 Tax=Halobellus rubicundus TaxID=2996466 RepID=A0ABD5MBE2_9EURY